MGEKETIKETEKEAELENREWLQSLRANLYFCETGKDGRSMQYLKGQVLI